MAYKNLEKKDRELDGDLLRQRRDFYAISIGLILFHAAGGKVRDDATLTTLPVHLNYPQVLYWATWVSFFYFGLRYWVLDPGGLQRFKIEWKTQARASSTFIKLITKMAKRAGYREDAESQFKAGILPAIPWASDAATLDLNFLRNIRTGDQGSLQQYFKDCQSRITFEQRDQRWLKIAWFCGFFRALLFERSATDLILPYIMGGVAILVAVLSQIMWCA